MLSFLRKTSLWIIGIPLLLLFTGIASNQAVLYANHDRFPVMVSEAKLFEYQHRLVKVVDGDGDEDADPDEAQVKLEELQHGFLDEVHCVMDSTTHLNFLADWIDLHDGTYSPGDVLQDLGEYLLGFSPLVWGVVVIGKLRKE